MAGTDLHQSEDVPQITGPLGDFVEFRNGRSSPDRTDSGAFAVYGSNGEIGKADVTNAPDGTLIVGRVGSYCGSVHYSPNKCWVTDNAIIGRSRSQKDSRFWFYKLASLELNNHRAGSGQPLLNQQILNSIRVSIPACEDDRFQIARVLAAFDDKIDLNRRINQTLEAMAQAIFKSWFVDFDPVKAKIAAKLEGRDPLRAAMSAISGKLNTELDTLPREQFDPLAATAALFPDEIEESELGEIPKGWTLLKVRDVCESIFSGGTPDTRRPEYWGGTLLWFSSGETRERVVVDTEKRINELAVENSSTRLARPGDILIASAGQGLTRGQTSYCAVETYINQSVVAIRVAPDRAHPAWLFNNLLGRYEEMRSISDSHSSRGSLTTKLIGGMHIVCPPTDVMARYGGLVDLLLQQQALDRLTAKALANLRDALLPRLISGELSVDSIGAAAGTSETT
ncbi:MAG: restriction endonuclease subunit S [Rhodocyclaceae bacterium]|nr:restriction endonuclease subunit S [Rhodocyclaceae bacterium]